MHTRLDSRPCRNHTRLALALGVTILFLCHRAAGVCAGEPQGEAGTTSTLPAFPKHTIRLTASEEGPFFTIEDLAAYTPISRPPAEKWLIRPSNWHTYPAELSMVPTLPRAYPAETVDYLSEHEIEHGDRQSPYMALTFDCESGTASTHKILDTLHEQNVQATFFVLGRYAYLFPEIVRRISEEGHEIGNHSFFHPQFTAITPVTATLEITYTEAVIDWAVGHHVPMRYIRFPYGGRNQTARQHAATLGYQSAFWDIDPRGWDPDKSAEAVVDHVRHTAHNGGIIIMHCGSWDDANALQEVIEAIRDSGHTPGPLTDVLSEQDWNVPDYPKIWPRRSSQQGTP